MLIIVDNFPGSAQGSVGKYLKFGNVTLAPNFPGDSGLRTPP